MNALTREETCQYRLHQMVKGYDRNNPVLIARKYQTLKEPFLLFYYNNYHIARVGKLCIQGFRRDT
jgi:hypothetical protein